MKKPYWMLFLLGMVLYVQQAEAQSLNFGKNIPYSTSPVLQVDVPHPTADKPQSKLWYMDGSWWTILPTSSGPSLWQRTENGWVEKEEVRESLIGVPGRADVWANGKVITAVAAGTKELAVFRVTAGKPGDENKWETEILSTLSPPISEGEIETATIAQDKIGNWWVAADFGDKVCVWGADPDARNWTDPIVLYEGINEDDISLVTVLPEGIGVIWSDQNTEAVSMRIHLDGDPVEVWSGIVTIEEGNMTADDHLNSVLTEDGTLWLVTKNGLDEEGEPQFVLRVRSTTGEWKNFPYADLNPPKMPSRPIILAVKDSSAVLSAHTVYHRGNPNLGEIVLGRVDTTSTEILKNITAIISPDTTGWTPTNRINDVTGPKMPFKRDIPWILLASDREGRVYEVDWKTIELK